MTNQTASQTHIRSNQQSQYVQATIVVVSKNHIEIIGEFEFFTDDDGNLYRARTSNSFDLNGYRLGGRWEAPPHMVETFLEMHRSFIFQPMLMG